MNILVTAATPSEILPFLEYYRHAHTKLPGPHSIDVLITGVGMMATTYALTRQVRLKRPVLIIQAGIGGCFDKQVPLGSLFAIKQDTIADQGVIESKKFLTLSDMGLMKKDQFPFRNGWLENNSIALKKTRLKKVRAISVNEATTSRQRIDYYREKFDPVMESMEGAALHYVGLMEKLPFLQLRSVSNYIGERNKKKWKMKEAIANLNNELIRMLNKL